MMASEQPVPDKVASWLVMWGCLCSDVRESRAELPKVCPGHGREPIAKPERIDALARFVDVHECRPETACPAPEPTS